MASTSWFIFIAPSSAAKLEADDPDQLDGEDRGAELGEQVRAEKAHGRPDEEVCRGDDRQGVEARALHERDGRRHPQPLRQNHDPGQGRGQAADEGQGLIGVRPDILDVLAAAHQHGVGRARFGLSARRLRRRFSDQRHEPADVGPGVQAAQRNPGADQDECAHRVEPPKPRDIEPGARGRLAQETLSRAAKRLRGPVADQGDHGAARRAGRSADLESRRLAHASGTAPCPLTLKSGLDDRVPWTTVKPM
jgi:hypothetical protein